MPVQLFTEAERARRNRFPDVIAYEDLVTFFTLSEESIKNLGVKPPEALSPEAPLRAADPDTSAGTLRRVPDSAF